MHTQLIDFLRLFKDIPAEDAGMITQQLDLRSVKEGDVLLSHGGIAREMFFISKGILKIVSINEKGDEIVQFFLKENRFCTILHSFHYNETTPESIVAACDSELIVLPREGLLYLNNAIPYFKPLIDGITQQALMDKIKVQMDYRGEDATIRYKKFMINQPDIALRVPLSDVASYLGITQQSLSRIRRNFK